MAWLVTRQKTQGKLERGTNMKQTIELMNQLSTLYLGPKDYCEMARIYQETEDPSILASVFVGVYRMLIQESKNYFGLTEHDIASLALEEIHKALTNYKFNSKASVITLIWTYFRRRLYAITNQNNTHKRQANFDTECYEELNVPCDEGYSKFELMEFIGSLNLNKSEQKFIEFIFEEPHEVKDTEIARAIGITSMGVRYVRNRIQEKFIAGEIELAVY